MPPWELLQTIEELHVPFSVLLAAAAKAASLEAKPVPCGDDAHSETKSPPPVGPTVGLREKDDPIPCGIEDEPKGVANCAALMLCSAPSAIISAALACTGALPDDRKAPPLLAEGVPIP